MDTRTIIRRGARRLLILFLVSVGVVFAGSEGAYIFQKEAFDRPPQVVELIIPAGTAENIAAGKAAPTFQEEMTFVLGDTLLVRNEDSVDHEFGPLWIPAGANASLVLDQADNFSYACSFRPSGYFGLEVKPPTTWQTRLTALFLAAPATALILFVYSLVIRPIQPEARPVSKVPGEPVPAKPIER
jgi:hypothetical protein